VPGISGARKSGVHADEKSGTIAVEGGYRMTQTQLLKRIQRAHWRSLQKAVRRAYQEGFTAGLVRAHGAGRRGRTIRADARIEGLLRRIERHFGLNRYAFEVRVVHAGSGRRIPARDLLVKYLMDEKPSRDSRKS